MCMHIIGCYFSLRPDGSYLQHIIAVTKFLSGKNLVQGAKNSWKNVPPNYHFLELSVWMWKISPPYECGKHWYLYPIEIDLRTDLSFSPLAFSPQSSPGHSSVTSPLHSLLLTFRSTPDVAALHPILYYSVASNYSREGQITIGW